MEIYIALFSTVENFCGTAFRNVQRSIYASTLLNTAVPKGDRRCRKRPEAPRRQRISGTRLLNRPPPTPPPRLHPLCAKWPRSNYPRDRRGGSINRLLLSFLLEFSVSLLSIRSPCRVTFDDVVRYRTVFKSHENFWDGNWVIRRLIESSEERSSSGHGLIPERDNAAVATSHAILQFRWKLLSSSRAFVLSRTSSRIIEDLARRRN